jgi:hypothetical protein
MSLLFQVSSIRSAYNIEIISLIGKVKLQLPSTSFFRHKDIPIGWDTRDGSCIRDLRVRIRLI